MIGEGKQVLLIDDDPDMHEAVLAILKPLGYRVTCCWTGPSGLAELRRKNPDVLLLDIMLATPTEGFHIAYEIKKDERLRHIPIIMISAIGQTMGMDFAKELGSDYVQAEQFLEKPLEAQTLRDAVARALEQGE